MVQIYLFVLEKKKESITRNPESVIKSVVSGFQVLFNEEALLVGV